jgi:hypothetical protein
MIVIHKTKKPVICLILGKALIDQWKIMRRFDYYALPL